MRNIHLTSVVIESFRSFSRPPAKFRLGDHAGLYFLQGQNQIAERLASNGSGKSTIWYALTWCIYGRTATLRTPDLKAWAGGVPKVTVTLTVDGAEHSIERVGKTNGLTIDGKEAGPDAAAELIGVSYELWPHCVVFAQAQPLFLDCSPKDKLDLLSTALKLERWDGYAEAAASKVKELEGLLRELEGERAGMLTAVEQTQELLDTAAKASLEWQRGQAEKRKTLEASRKTLQENLDAARRALGDADLAYDSAMTEIKPMRKALQAAQDRFASERRSLDHWQMQYNMQFQHRSDAERALNKVRRERVCPTCNQQIRLNRETLVDHQAVKLAKSKTDLADYELSRDMALQRASHLEAHVKRDTELLAQFETNAEAALTIIHFRKPQVAEFEARLAMLGDVEERNPHQNHVANLKRKVAQLTAQYEELQIDIRKANQKIEQHRFWAREGFKDVKLQLLREVLQEMAVTTNAMLPEIGLEGWRIDYDLEKETKSGLFKSGISVTIAPQGQAEGNINWFSWSGGEAQRLRLAASLALSQVLLGRVGVGINLLVLDEPTRGMTTRGVEELIDFLAQLAPQQNKTIWLVDHVARESSKFAGGATVVKTEAGSIIQQGD